MNYNIDIWNCNEIANEDICLTGVCFNLNISLYYKWECKYVKLYLSYNKYSNDLRRRSNTIDRPMSKATPITIGGRVDLQIQPHSSYSVSNHRSPI